jgi:hypothetical protein
MVVNINVILYTVLFLSSMVGCSHSKSENSVDQLYLVHIGESDKPIEDILIYVDNNLIRNDIDSTFMVKFKITASEFDDLRRYVIEKDTEQRDCQQCNRGTFKVDLFWKKKSTMYVVEREMGKRYFARLSTLAKSNKDLQKFIESNIVEQL